MSIGIVVFIIPIACLSQKNFADGYIFNNNMERIEGQIEKLSDISNCQYVNFKEGEHTIKYLPNQITSWGIVGSRLFVSQSIIVADIEEMVFLEYIVTGKLSLLCYYGVDDDPRFFIQKEGDELRELVYSQSIDYYEGKLVEDKKFIGVLTILLYDCAELKDEISSTPYKLNNLRKLVVEYNECIDADGVVFVKDVKEKSPVNFEFLVGYNLPQYDVITTDKDRDDWIIDAEGIPTNYFSFGVNFSAKVSKIEGVSFNLGVLYSNTEFKFGTSTYTNSILTLPMQIRYAYRIGKFSPYVGVGYTSVFYPKHEGAYILFRTHHYGWNAGLGLKYQVFEFAGVFFNFSYQSVRAEGYNPPKKDTPPFDYLKLKTNTMSFCVGVSF